MPIKYLYVRRFGCIQEVEVELTPLHAFIGPNDSGKSTLLNAVGALSIRVGVGAGLQMESSQLRPQRLGEKGTYLAAARTPGWRIHVAGDDNVPKLSWPGQSDRALKGILSAQFEGRAEALSFVREIAGARLLRLDPDALREKSRLIPQSSPVTFSERGGGLPGVYDAILGRDVDVFQSISRDLAAKFPAVSKLQLQSVTETEKELSVKLVNGTVVTAERMSEGLLYYLAFAALPYLEPTPILLVEEPENGLHPARIAEVMRVLRDVSTRSQVLLATHSPLVVNELEPEEVSVVTRDPKLGTQVIRVDRTPNFVARSKVYALGELWVSYADGELEAPLLTGAGE